MSPFEHQATPDTLYQGQKFGSRFNNAHQHGNFHGWIQYRKTIPNEAVAKMPEGYA
jgi:hypothetical protein